MLPKGKKRADHKPNNERQGDHYPGEKGIFPRLFIVHWRYLLGYDERAKDISKCAQGAGEMVGGE